MVGLFSLYSSWLNGASKGSGGEEWRSGRGGKGAEPKSIEFFHEVGLQYVSCSPYRVPAQAGAMPPRPRMKVVGSEVIKNQASKGHLAPERMASSCVRCNVVFEEGGGEGEDEPSPAQCQRSLPSGLSSAIFRNLMNPTNVFQNIIHFLSQITPCDWQLGFSSVDHLVVD